MDYSVVDEHPESSPWATSPEHNRTSFKAPPQSPGFATNSTRVDHEDDGIPDEDALQNNANSNQDSLPEDERPLGRLRANEDQPTASSQRQAPKKRKERPQYKLQAKITGLERNSRKDPIFKFDVYVGCST